MRMSIKLAVVCLVLFPATAVLAADKDYNKDYDVYTDVVYGHKYAAGDDDGHPGAQEGQWGGHRVAGQRGVAFGDLSALRRVFERLPLLRVL